MSSARRRPFRLSFLLWDPGKLSAPSSPPGEMHDTGNVIKQGKTNTQLKFIEHLLLARLGLDLVSSSQQPCETGSPCADEQSTERCSSTGRGAWLVFEPGLETRELTGRGSCHSSLPYSHPTCASGKAGGKGSGAAIGLGRVWNRDHPPQTHSHLHCLQPRLWATHLPPSPSLFLRL